MFPTEHVRRIIAAARDGKTLLQVSVYDGSDTGEKIYDTLTVIGKAIAPDEHKPTDAVAGQAAFAGLTRWPVTISYFDHAVAEKSGEQTPVYAITFELYENGISRALLLDYGDFVLDRRDDVAGDQGREALQVSGSRAFRAAVDPRLGQLSAISWLCGRVAQSRERFCSFGR